MKKSIIIGKRQILLILLLLGLGAAVYLNVVISGGSNEHGAAETVTDSNLGDALFVNANTTQNPEDYFVETRKNREESKKASLDSLNEIIENPKSSSSAISSAEQEYIKISTFANTENKIESLVKAKGFTDCIAVMNVNDVSILVQCDELLSSDTIQIQDIAASATGYSYENIKIIEVKNS